jgi:hypothetical protein
MAVALHQLLLVIAVLALGDAGLRVASLLAPSGLERVVSAVVLGAAGAVIEALALGLLGLGGSAAALSAVPVLASIAARLWLPAPAVSPASELGAWWVRLGTVERAGIGAVAGGFVALAAILVHRPQPGYDGITYHIPEVVGFVQGGHPGAVLRAYYGLPVGNYPLTNEVLLAWMTGISRGFAALTLWTPLSALLVAVGGWLGLRRLGVSRPVRALSLAALLLGPLLVQALSQPGTDLPALGWLTCCVALCVCAVKRPALLAVAFVAFGLAVGTKTTPAVLGLIVLGAGLWASRRRLRSILWPLLAGLVAAALAGGVWYLRNLFTHGSPLWPFVSAPWGDPVPASLKLVDHTMVERLRVTLLDHFHAYLSGVSGSTVLLAAGVLVSLLALTPASAEPDRPTRRALLFAAGLVALGTLVWADAPVTGLPDIPALGVAAGTAVRYLMPVFAAGALALALAATGGPRWGRPLAVAALAGALIWGLRSDQQHTFFLPFTSWLGAGVVVGAVAAAVAREIRLPRFARGAAGATLAVAALVALSIGSSGFLARHGLVATEWDAAAAAFLSSRPGFGSAHEPVATAPVAIGPEAGDHLTHRISLIGENEACSSVRARAARGWVVVRLVTPLPIPGHPGLVFPPRGSAQPCLAALRAQFDDGAYRIYGP